MRLHFSRAGLRGALLSTLSLLAMTAAHAQDGARDTDVDQVVITAARTILPASALPLTVDVIDQATLSQQVAISGSIVDAVSTLSPSFSPTRQKLSGAGKPCAAARRSTPSTASRSRRRSATARATATPSTRSSSTASS
ncbi:hypothetical protein [Caulobacter sp. FWC2]|uniref:hypothetical protein n=1 Tax=Caulobacter sp. FWC2 TaxID=69664 RepID=UPI001E4DFDAD|nr:hypothetical protein [Caulobacter sp. FWC2]